MLSVSDLLVAGLAGPRPVPPTGQYVVPEELAEALDDWMQEFIRQVRLVAPKYLAFLKAETGRGFKLFKTFLTDNGKVIVRFDPAKRTNMEFGPMVVLRVGYSKGADLYDFQVEVYNVNVAEKLGSYETLGGDVELLADPSRMLYGVRDALSQLQLRKARTEDEQMGHASQLEESLLADPVAEEGETPEQIARMQRNTAFAKRAGAIGNKKPAAAAEPEKKPGLIKRGMKMVFGKWAKVEGTEAEGPDVFELDETLIGKGLDEAMTDMDGTDLEAVLSWASTQLSKIDRAMPDQHTSFGKRKEVRAVREAWTEANTLRGKAWRISDTQPEEAAKIAAKVPEAVRNVIKLARALDLPDAWKKSLSGLGEANVTARLNLGTEGGTFGDERTNPTKSGPSAERANVLRQAKYGIDKMREAVEVVREWVGKFNLGDRDKTGSAAAALRLAAEEIEKVESAQGALADLIEVPYLDGRAILRVVTEATEALTEKTATLPGLDQARGGLARLMEGLRQIHGMLRQAKLGGRILDQLEAAIKGLKVTRDALDSLVEGKTSKSEWEAALKKDEADLAQAIKDIKTLEGGGSVKNLTLANAKKAKSGLEAAIANKKKLIGGLDECGGMSIGGSIDASGYGKKYERAPASAITKGSWIQGGVPEDPMYRQVVAVEREENAPYVVLVLDQPYVGSDGQKHSTARFHTDALVPQAS